MGFTDEDGPSPHSMAAPTVAPRPQPPQSDGRTPPPLPPRPRSLRAPPLPWHETRVKQGPVPEWASFVAAWYNAFWSLSRVMILAGMILFLAPFLHVTSWLAFRVSAAARRWPHWVRRLCWAPLRSVKWLFGGVVFFLCESVTSCQYLFSGQVEPAFWERVLTTATKEAATIIASGVPNAGGAGGSIMARQSGNATTAAAASNSSGDATASAAPAAAPAPVTLFLSNVCSYTCFLDALPFWSLAYRRSELAGLWFLPLATGEWGWGSQLLHWLLLSPLTVRAAEIDVILEQDAAQNTCSSFVCFPEVTAEDDTAPAVPMAGQAAPSPRAAFAGSELLHVQAPTVSATMVHLLLRCTLGMTSRGAIALPRAVSVVEVTLAYSGSVHAELELKALDDLADNTNSGALDIAEEDEFERGMTTTDENGAPVPAAAAEVAETSDEGYSAETINDYAHGRITSRRPRSYNPEIPFFCTAAPLHPVVVTQSPLSSSAAGSARALVRERVVPSFYAFLSGNAPTTVNVLLNQYDEEYVRRRILQLPANSSSGGSGNNGSAQLSAAEESSFSEAAVSRRRLACCSVDSWLHPRFLHQEQQLALFSVHAQFHWLPSSLSASSIPVCQPLESFAVPVSSIKAAKFMAIVWTLIVCTTLAVRNTRAAFTQQEPAGA